MLRCRFFFAQPEKRPFSRVLSCSLCVDGCPAAAIFDEADLPEEYARYATLNAELTKVWPLIKDKPEPLPDADQWVEVKEKLLYLQMAEIV